MFPDMVPEEYRNRLQYPYPLPTLSGADLEKALQALVHFLLEVSGGDFPNAVSVRCLVAYSTFEKFGISFVFFICQLFKFLDFFCPGIYSTRVSFF